MHFSWDLTLLILSATSVVRSASLAPLDGCKELESKFKDQVTYAGSAAYTTETSHYWSRSVVLKPLCVFTPTSSKDIATAIPILKRCKAQFAVRGNGHMTVKGANSIDNGVLIALSKLRGLTISADKEIASLGPGLTWQEVYDFVQPYGKSVVGGRFDSVGVAGFLLGGGISFHGSQYGWGASSVVNYEVVNANGEIIQASATSNSDLFWALKGGGSNFGIVTRFDVRTHPGGPVFGGIYQYQGSTAGRGLEEIAAFAAPGGGIDNPKVSILPNYFIIPSTGDQFAAVIGFYDGADGTALKNFTDTASIHTARQQTFPELVKEGSSVGPSGDFRGAFHCTSLKASAETILLINETVTAAALTDLASIPGSQVVLSIQPISKSVFQSAKAAGGDAIDLQPENGNVVIFNLYTQWSNPSDDEKVAQWAKDKLLELEQRAKAVDLFYPFIYLNDAQEGAQPFPLYGFGKSYSKLKSISSKYDPTGVFQTLMPGGFKL